MIMKLLCMSIYLNLVGTLDLIEFILVEISANMMKISLHAMQVLKALNFAGVHQIDRPVSQSSSALGLPSYAQLAAREVDAAADQLAEASVRSPAKGGGPRWALAMRARPCTLLITSDATSVIIFSQSDTLAR